MLVTIISVTIIQWGIGNYMFNSIILLEGLINLPKCNLILLINIKEYD